MDATFRPFPVPDSGDTRADVEQLLGAFVTLVRDTPFPKLMAAFIDAAEREPDLARMHAELTRRRREPLLVVLERGRRRGELPADLDLELTCDLLAAPFFYRRFIAHHPIPPTMVADVVAKVL